MSDIVEADVLPALQCQGKDVSFCANCDAETRWIIFSTLTPLCHSCHTAYQWGQNSPGDETFSVDEKDIFLARHEQIEDRAKVIVEDDQRERTSLTRGFKPITMKQARVIAMEEAG